MIFDEWRLPTFLFLSLYPVTLFILARILFPFNVQDGPIDLKEFYYANFRKFFISTMILTVLSIASNIIVRGFMGDQIIQISLFAFLDW